MELTTLRQFAVIAREGHITRAAGKLGVSQPALSAMLRKLEAEVGAPLLHRTAHGVEPTEAGRAFLDHAERSVRSADAAVEAVRELVGLERGSIRIGGGATVTTYVLPPVISRFRAQHPGIRFYVREAGSAEIAGAVSMGELDLGVITPPQRGAVDGLVLSGLATDAFRLIVPPGHRLEGRPSFRWGDLRGQSMVAFEAGSAVRAVIDRALGTAGVDVVVVMELRSIESIKRMVEQGVGIALVSRFALAEGEGLVCADGEVERTLAIARRSDRVPSAAVAAFEAALRAGAQARSGGSGGG